MKRKIFFIILSLIMAGTIAYFYINKIFLPIKAKELLTTKIQQALKRDVTIEKVSYNPIKGLIITNLKIAKKDEPQKPFIEADQIYFNILITPFIKEKKIVIPSISIINPYFQIERLGPKEFNFSDILTRKPEENGSSPYTLLLRKLSIRGAHVDYRDDSAEKSFEETLTKTNIEVILTLKRSAQFALKIFIPKQNSQLSLKGEYTYPSQKITSEVAIQNCYLARYFEYLFKTQSISLKSGLLNTASGTLLKDKDKIQFAGSLDLTQLDLDLPNNQRIAGNFLSPNIQLNRENKQLTANGTLQANPLKLSLSNNREISGELFSQIQSFKMRNNNISLDGHIDLNDALIRLKEQSIRGHLKAVNLSLDAQGKDIILLSDFIFDDAFIDLGEGKEIQGDIKADKTNLSFKNQALEVTSTLRMDDADIKFNQIKSLNGQIISPQLKLIYKDQITDLKGEVHVNHADLQLKNDITFRGDPESNFALHYDPVGKIQTYEGTLLLKDATFAGIKRIGEVKNVSGRIEFSPQFLRMDSLKFNTFETDFTLSGQLRDFINPIVDLTGQTGRFDLQTLAHLFPDQFREHGLTVEGLTSFDFKFKGPVKTFHEADISLNTKLQNASLSSTKWDKNATQINGELIISKNRIQWKNFKGTYQKKAYALDGDLINFKQPAVKTSLTSQDINLTTQFKFLDEKYQISSLSGKFMGSTFDIKGDIFLPKNKEPKFDINGQLGFDCENIKLLVPQLWPKISRFDPKGRIHLDGKIAGELKKWQNWQFALNGQSPLFEIKSFPFMNVSMYLTQDQNGLSQLDLTSQLYEGQLSITSTSRLFEESLPTSFDIRLDKMNLAKLKDAKKTKNKHLAGNLSLTTHLDASLNNFKDVQGRGTLIISEGNLWQWKILEGLFGALLIPEFKNIVFTDATASFKIGDQKVFTDNTRLVSDRVILNGRGWVDFNKNIHMNVNPQFSEIAILQSDSLKKGPTSLLTQIIDIELTGTLDKPKYNVKSSARKALEKTTDILKEGIQGILEEIIK